MTATKNNVMDQLAELTAELNRHDLALGELAQVEQDKIREAREARAKVEEFWENAGARDAINEAELADLAAACNRAESAIRTRREFGNTEVEEHVGIRAEMASIKLARNQAAWVLKEFSEANRTEIERALVEESIERFDALHTAVKVLWAEVKRADVQATHWTQHWQALGLTRYPPTPPSAASILSAIKPSSYDMTRVLPSAPVDLLADPDVISHMREHGHDRLAADLERKLGEERERETYLAKRRQREAA